MSLPNVPFSILTIQSIYNFLSQGSASSSHSSSGFAQTNRKKDKGKKDTAVGGLVAVSDLDKTVEQKEEKNEETDAAWASLSRPSFLLRKPPNMESDLRFEFNKIGFQCSELSFSMRTKLMEMFRQAVQEEKESALLQVLQEMIPKFVSRSIHETIVEIIRQSIPQQEKYLQFENTLLVELKTKQLDPFLEKFNLYQEKDQDSTLSEDEKAEALDRWTKVKTEYTNTLCFFSLVDGLSEWLDFILRPALFNNTDSDSSSPWSIFQTMMWYKVAEYLLCYKYTADLSLQEKTLRSSAVIADDVERLFPDKLFAFPDSKQRFHIECCIRLFRRNADEKQTKNTEWFVGLIKKT